MAETARDFPCVYVGSILEQRGYIWDGVMNGFLDGVGIQSLWLKV